MKHYGDITQLSGYELPIVDVIVGGSPCQDLSVAGKRAGLDGERSGLFMEQVRLVKEMRERDGLENGRPDYLRRPRYMVWENVPGAFSSNGGEDFKTVIEEIVRIVESEVPDLRTVVHGGWTKSGCVYSSLGEWSIAWRVHDAQFWGVPQRRKRISLIADFGGLSAPEILFERKGLSRNPEQSSAEREGTAEGTQGSVGEAGRCLNAWDVQSKHIQPESGLAESLYAGECRYGGGESYVMGKNKAFGISSYDSNSMKSSNPHSGIYEADTSRTLDMTGGSPACNQGGVAIVASVDMIDAGGSNACR